jgi:hypothetical protein
MGDLNDPPPAGSRWRSIGFVGGSYRIPVAPGPPPRRTKAQREQQARDEARGEAQVARMHLVGLFRAGVIVMGLVLAAVVVLAVLALKNHR